MSRKPELKGRAARLARLLPAGRARAARTPFVLLVVLLLGGGLIVLLVLNSALSEGSFRLDDLKEETKNLTDQEQALQRDVDAYSAPQALQRRARELGMVPGGDPAFLAPDGTVKGSAGPASGPATPLVVAPEALIGPPEPLATTTPAVPPPAPPRRAPPRPHAAADGTGRDTRRAHAHPDPYLRQVTQVSDREPPRRRVPGPARPARSGGQGRRPGPGARPPRRPGPGRPAAPRTIRLGSPRPRLRLIGLALTLVLVAFTVRLLQVQAVDAGTFAARAEQNRYVVHTLPPSAAASPTATAWPWRPPWTPTTSPPTPRCSPASS